MSVLAWINLKHCIINLQFQSVLEGDVKDFVLGKNVMVVVRVLWYMIQRAPPHYVYHRG